MHKKIESELVSLAHGILQLKNKEDVLVLKEKARQVYEKLSVLAFVDRFVEATPAVSKDEVLEKVEAFENREEDENVIEELQIKSTEETKNGVEEIIKEEKIEEVIVEKQKPVVEKEKVVIVEKEVEVLSKELVEEEKLEIPVVEDLFSIRKEEKVSVTMTAKNSLEKELEGTISIDVSTEIFEKAIRIETPRKSLNDVLIGQNLQIGLNDRIAFVKHLFDGSQEDFNRVVSQLNSFKTEKEAIQFVTNMVKLDYDWKGKEAYEDRFITLITRKFA